MTIYSLQLVRDPESQKFILLLLELNEKKII